MREVSRPLKIFLIAVSCIAILTLLAFFLHASLVRFIDTHTEVHNARQSSRIIDRNGLVLYEIPLADESVRTHIDLRDLPQHCQDALLTREDQSFYSNNGVDIARTLKASFGFLQSKSDTGGASTITQQLIKNIEAKQTERTVTQKASEMVEAILLSATTSKPTILTSYINSVYVGNGIYGIANAANKYFGKNTKDLSLAECAYLFSITQNPTLYNPYTHHEDTLARSHALLTIMSEKGKVSEEQLTVASAETLSIKRQPKNTMQLPHTVFYVLDLLERTYPELDLTSGNIDILLTVDAAFTEKLQKITQTHLSKLEDFFVSNSAILITDPTTGAILAMQGSKDFWDESIDGQVNMTTQKRQIGSTVKPFTYGLFFAAGHTPDTLVSDTYTILRTEDDLPYTPQNYDGTFHGVVTAREALANSYNAAAINTLATVGLPSFFTLFDQLGLTLTSQEKDRLGLSIGLGAREQSLLELSEGYSIFPNHGTKVPLTIIDSITQNAKPITLKRSAPRHDILSQDVTNMISDVLSDNTARQLQFGERNDLKLPFAAAVKTGTSRNYVDNWTIGYIPRLMVAVWVGNNSGKAMKGVSGSTGAAPIWNTSFLEAVNHFHIDTSWAPTHGSIVHTQPENKILIDFPRDGEVYVREDSFTTLPLKSSQNVTWILDDTSLGQGTHLMIPMLPGVHSLKAEFQGTSENIYFTIK